MKRTLSWLVVGLVGCATAAEEAPDTVHEELGGCVWKEMSARVTLPERARMCVWTIPALVCGSTSTARSAVLCDGTTIPLDASHPLPMRMCLDGQCGASPSPAVQKVQCCPP
jgi:hypothetical protein